jgi:hypothetical protein
MVSDVVVAVIVGPPEAGVAVTVYEVIAYPPSLAGAVQETVADPLPGAAVTPVGVPGVVDTRTAPMRLALP